MNIGAVEVLAQNAIVAYWHLADNRGTAAICPLQTIADIAQKKVHKVHFWCEAVIATELLV